MATESGLPLRARVYLGFVIVAGLAVIAESLYQLVAYPIGFQWFLLATLTLISGSTTVRLPSVAATISISEVFVFAAVLLFGPPAGTLTVALDALVITFWQQRRRPRGLQRVLFNVSATSLSCWVGAKLFFFVSGIRPLAQSAAQIHSLLPALVVFAIVYFVLNSWLITFAISFETGQAAARIWRENFALLSLNYFGGASVAALLVSYTGQLDYSSLAIIVPLLLVLYITFATSMGRVEDANKHLSELNSLYISTIETLAMAIDAKDQITHGHIRRVQRYAVGLATALGIKEESQIKAIEAAALLHDMGKLAVPEYILNKPGPLTSGEFEKIKLHATVGADILSSIAFPYPVVPIVRHHHENWDGTGYPAGLRSTDIPLGARILSVVDCFDALTSDRPYRPRLSDSDAVNILLKRRGTMYDPLIVDTFIQVHRELGRAIDEAESSVRELLAVAGPERVQATKAVHSLEDISSSTEEMLTLYELASALASKATLGEAIDTVSKHLRRMIPAPICVFFGYYMESDELVAEHSFGDKNGTFAELRVPFGQRLTGWVAANRQTILNSDPVLDLGDVGRSWKPRLRSCLSTPLVHNHRLVGVLSLYSFDPHAFTEDHQRVLEAVAKQVAPTIALAVLQEQREPDSSAGVADLHPLDRLTQLLAARFSRQAQEGSDLSILFVAINGLELSNWRKERDVAEQVFERVTAAVRRALGNGDMLFRFGNNGLIALLAEANRDAALAVAQMVSTTIKSVSLPKTALDHKVTVSVGFATAPSDGIMLDQLVVAARSRSFREISPTDQSSIVH